MKEVIPHKKKGRLTNRLLNATLIILIFCSALMIINRFYFDLYYIPSNSMASTLLPGDLVLVRKTDTKNKLNIKRGEILVFIQPEEEKIYIKRCSGIPGDRVQLVNSELFVNGNPELTNAAYVYSCRISSTLDLVKKLDSLNVEYIKCSRSNKKNTWIVYAKRIELDKVLNCKAFGDVGMVNFKAHPNAKMYPYTKNINGSRDNWGPVTIPFVGMEISSKQQLDDWLDPILNTQESKTQISNDYYFMLGDNRHDSNDSRYWGFLNEEQILGKVKLLIFSQNPKTSFFEGIRWKRILKTVE